MNQTEKMKIARSLGIEPLCKMTDKVWTVKRFQREFNRGERQTRTILEDAVAKGEWHKGFSRMGDTKVTVYAPKDVDFEYE